ncbi:hypothetical protein SNE40_012019 [Patella caerulea]|uniref:Uncharacterized protein n=1 Tax=Patella caerulea TaxID=87958 RepID=A0AAN8JQP4_PATCE
MELYIDAIETYSGAFNIGQVHIKPKIGYASKFNHNATKMPDDIQLYAFVKGTVVSVVLESVRFSTHNTAYTEMGRVNGTGLENSELLGRRYPCSQSFPIEAQAKKQSHNPETAPSQPGTATIKRQQHHN